MYVQMVEFGDMDAIFNNMFPFGRKEIQKVFWKYYLNICMQRRWLGWQCHIAEEKVGLFLEHECTHGSLGYQIKVGSLNSHHGMHSVGKINKHANKGLMFVYADVLIITRLHA